MDTADPIDAIDRPQISIDDAPDAVFIADASGRYVDANPAACLLIGLARDQILGRTVAEFLPAADLPRLQSVRTRIAAGETDCGEWQMRHAEGHDIDVEVSSRMLPSGNLIAIVRDITGRRRNDVARRFLAEASEIIASSLDRDETLNRIAALVVPQAADWCTIDLVTPAGIERVAVAHANPADAHLAAALKRYPAAATPGPSADVLASNQSAVYPEVTPEMLFASAGTSEQFAIRQAIGVVSSIVVPLTARGRTLGILSLFSTDARRRYDDDDLALAEELGRRCALAIDNAQLYAGEQRARLRVSALAQASQAFAEARLDLGDVLGSVVRQVAEQIGEGAGIFLIDDSGQWLRTAAIHHPDPRSRQIMTEGFSEPYPVGFGVIGGVAASGMSQVERLPRVDLSDIDADPRFREYLATMPPQAVAAAPLRTPEGTIGVIACARYRTDHPYVADDVRFLEDLANRASFAIANARLFAEAREAERRYRQLFDRNPQPAWLFDPVTYRFLEVNDAAVRHYGYSRDEFLTMTIADIRAADDVPRLRQSMELAPSDTPRRWQHVTKDGRNIDVEIVWSDFQIDGARRRLVVASDITERLRAEQRQRDLQQARQAQQAAEQLVEERDRFLSIASHELRTPLAGVRGYVDLVFRALARGDLDADRLRRYLEGIDEGSRRLAQLVNDLLDVSRVRGGQLSLNVAPVNLTTLLQDTISRSFGEDTVHELLTDIDEVTVLGDAGRLQQVIANLIDNAIKYSPNGGPIGIRLRQGDSSVLLTVEDSGIGVPAGDHGRIFAPFGRAQNAASGHIGGIGLGLYICREIVELHGGTIDLVSDGVGKGTRVMVTFPRPA